MSGHSGDQRDTTLSETGTPSLGLRLLALALRFMGVFRRPRRLGWRRVQQLRDRGEPVVFALLHGRALLMLTEMRDEGCMVLVSRSADGNLAAGLLHAMGYQLARGSTSRGGAAGLRQLARGLDLGLTPTLTVDGPRGPAGLVAPGVAALARLTGAAVVPVSASCSAGHRLRTWDKSVIPFPWAKRALLFGRPLRYGKGQGITDDAFCATLQQRLDSLQRRADRTLGASQR